MTKFTFQDYLDALGGAGPERTQAILTRAALDPGISPNEMDRLLCKACLQL